MQVIMFNYPMGFVNIVEDSEWDNMVAFCYLKFPEHFVNITEIMTTIDEDTRDMIIRNTPIIKDGNEYLDFNIHSLSLRTNPDFIQFIKDVATNNKAYHVATLKSLDIPSVEGYLWFDADDISGYSIVSNDFQLRIEPQLG